MHETAAIRSLGMISYRAPTRQSFLNDGLGEVYDSFEDYAEEHHREHQGRSGRAQGLYLAIYDSLQKVVGNRPAISEIRSALSNNEDFIELSPMVVELTGTDMDWISAIIRVEAKRVAREGAARLEEIRRAREEAKRLELAAEKAAIEELPEYGMF